MDLTSNIPVPDTVFDGGDLDCGSGLILLIREHMLRTPVDGILEMRSREPTVVNDLPPWCRMAGHTYLGTTRGENCTRYFVQRGKESLDDQNALAQDKEEAKGYQWRLRARSTGHLKSTVYARACSFTVGQPASFEERDEHPCAVEYFLGALAGSLTTAFATECARDGLEVDDIEISLSGSLLNVLAHLGLEPGEPSIERIEIKCFASTFDDERLVKTAWERTLSRSPLVTTLNKAVDLQIKLALV